MFPSLQRTRRKLIFIIANRIAFFIYERIFFLQKIITHKHGEKIGIFMDLMAGLGAKLSNRREITSKMARPKTKGNLI